MAVYSDDDVQRARTTLDRMEPERRGRAHQLDRLAQAFADYREELIGHTEYAQRIREIRNAAWREGYEACRRGEQPHSPYHYPPKTKRETD